MANKADLRWKLGWLRRRLPLFGIRRTLNFPNAYQAILHWEEIANYPIKTVRDLQTIHNCCQRILREIDTVWEREHYQKWVTAVHQTAVASTPEPLPGGSLDIMDFATADHPILAFLRDEVRLPPPPGGVVVRKHFGLAVAPPHVRQLFETSRINLNAGDLILCRFVMVNADVGLPPHTLSHELVHAYTASLLGYYHSYNVPTWFDEGVAVYITHLAQPIMLEDYYNGEGYKTYRLIFHYLDHQLGRAGLFRLIRNILYRQDFQTTMTQTVGTDDMNELLTRASQAVGA